jgi:signal transduction histidine kinase/ActR/RegA family two-component response regulator
MPRTIRHSPISRRRRRPAPLPRPRASDSYIEALDLLQRVLGQMPGAASLDDLLVRTVGVLHQLTGNSSTAVLQVLPGGDLLYGRAYRSNRPYTGSPTMSIDTGLIGAAARSGQTVVVPDVARDPRYIPAAGWVTRSELCVPIITRDGLWGVLNLESERTNAFPPKLVQIAEIIAQQLAIAVENTTLVDQAREQTLLLERRARELTQILTLNSQLRVGMEMQVLLQHLADAIRSVMGFQSVVVNLVDVAENRVWVAAIAGYTGADEALLREATYAWNTFLGDNPERFRVSHSYFIPAEAGVVTEGVSIRPMLDERAPHEWQADDMLMIPIANHQGAILGVLSVDDPTDRQRPSLATIQGLEIFASQAAAAIENARLFAQAQDALQALRRSHEEQARLLDQVQRTQAELLMASKLAAVGTLAAGVAHEFNNLLAGMHGYAELGLSGALDDKDEALEIVRQTCQRGVQITRRLLTFARPGNGERVVERIDEIAQSALQLISWDLAKANIAVMRDYHSTASIWADAGQITQVVLNLLTNARDAMPNGGTLTVGTRESDDWVELTVQDTGSGIPDAIRERIFEPFVTTKGALGGSRVAGTGLGLSVSYGIVQAHNGRLLVESSDNQGSRFTIQLPRSSGVLVDDDPVPPPARTAHSYHILVVDDEPQVRAVLVGLLNHANHTVAQASDGQEVVERCEHERWDLIVSDVTMPLLDGPGMIQRLRDLGVDTPVILVTGRVDIEGLARARESDAAVLVTKPFEAATLLRAVAAAVGDGRDAHTQGG